MDILGLVLVIRNTTTLTSTLSARVASIKPQLPSTSVTSVSELRTRLGNDRTQKKKRHPKRHILPHISEDTRHPRAGWFCPNKLATA